MKLEKNAGSLQGTNGTTEKWQESKDRRGKKNPAVLHRDDQKKENLKYVAE